MSKTKEVKPIILRNPLNCGKDYTLEFNRESVRFAESRGFAIEDVERYPLSKTYDLFYFAFRMHHKNVARDFTDRIIDEEWGGIARIPEAVMGRLGELYGVPFGTLVPDDEEPKNSQMTVEL